MSLVGGQLAQKGGGNVFIHGLRVRITGRSPKYKVHVEIDADTDSIAHLRECLRPFAPELYLTTSEVQADLASGGIYDFQQRTESELP